MADETLSPISAPKPPAVNPLGQATSTHASTLKLKPVIRKPVIGGAKPGFRPGLKLPAKAAPAAPAAEAAAPADAQQPPSATDQLKGMTQKLKGVTQQIPQQAILRKTGIIADESLTEAQKQASKSRTARISLSDAIGVAPVQSEAAPMKTIRIKRPVAPAASAEPATPPAETPAEPAAAADAAPTVTQKKTLKVSRPGAGGKLSLRKPGSTPVAKPAGDDEVADIPDLPAETAPAPLAPVAPVTGRIKDVPMGLQVFDLILQIAACVAIGYLGYLLYLDCEAQWF